MRHTRIRIIIIIDGRRRGTTSFAFCSFFFFGRLMPSHNPLCHAQTLVSFFPSDTEPALLSCEANGAGKTTITSPYGGMVHGTTATPPLCRCCCLLSLSRFTLLPSVNNARFYRNHLTFSAGITLRTRLMFIVFNYVVVLSQNIYGKFK